MKRVKKQIKWLATIFTVGVSITALMYIFLIVKSETKITHLTLQLTNYQDMQKNFQQNEKAVILFRATVDSLARLKDSLDLQIADASKIPLVLEQTASIFRQNHVMVLAGKPEFNYQQTTRDSLVKMPLSWQVRGPFLSIVNAFEAFDHLPVRQWINAFHGIRSHRYPGTIQVEFQSMIWVKGDTQ